MIHGRCSDCGTDLRCSDVIWVYRQVVGIHPSNGALWCPVCLLKFLGYEETARDLMDIDCRSCAGAAGATHIREVLHGHDLDTSTVALGMAFDHLHPDTGEATTSVWRPPAGATPHPPAPTIKLEPGELRCSCNNCEHLRIA